MKKRINYYIVVFSSEDGYSYTEIYKRFEDFQDELSGEINNYYINTIIPIYGYLGGKDE